MNKTNKEIKHIARHNTFTHKYQTNSQDLSTVYGEF